MAFNGSFPAPGIVAAAGGLFTVADVQTHAANDLRWATEEYRQEHNGTYEVEVYRNGTSPAGLDWAVSPDEGINSWPFEIVVKATVHGIMEINQEQIDKVKAFIDQITEAAVEHELMYGAARQGAQAQVLSGIDAAGRDALPARSITEALAALEMPTGADGKYTPMPRVIHLPADVATHAKSMLRPIDEEGRIYTRLGTPVVVGNGYEDGDGPNSPDYTPASRWGYVTGALSVHLSDIYDLEDALRQGFQPHNNRLIINLSRTAAVTYDPTPEMAVKIDLTQ